MYAYTYWSLRCNSSFGELSEWFMVTVLKTVVRQRTGGSNLSLSADKYLNFFIKCFNMYIELVNIKPGKKFIFECKQYEVLNEKASNPLEVKVYNHTDLRTQCLPRYTHVPCDLEFWRELQKEDVF